MSLPVSSYEELLARVRSLTHETIQLQRELASPLLQPGHGLGHGPAHAATATTVDLNDNEHVVTTSSLANATCDNARRAPSAVWPAPANVPATSPNLR
ncbi:hypothetical protein R5R35_014751 [Gryllus longicercus]|uniref:Uncharacterized protein n=1 Tax=Gryllus longicercus TaxID=2509291 RepID=A0AAN9YYQ1_9ORTH